MTIIISAQTYQELFAEVNETQQSNDPDDELDVTWKCPQALGEGHYRRVELRQNLVLEIESYQRHENLIIQGIDRPHPLEFWFMLSGQWRENSLNCKSQIAVLAAILLPMYLVGSCV